MWGIGIDSSPVLVLASPLCRAPIQPPLLTPSPATRAALAVFILAVQSCSAPDEELSSCFICSIRGRDRSAHRLSPCLGCSKCPAVGAGQGSAGWAAAQGFEAMDVLPQQHQRVLVPWPTHFQTLPQSTICSSSTKAQPAMHRKQFPRAELQPLKGLSFCLSQPCTPEDMSCPRSEAVLSSPLAVLPVQVEFWQSFARVAPLSCRGFVPDGDQPWVCDAAQLHNVAKG